MKHFLYLLLLLTQVQFGFTQNNPAPAPPKPAATKNPTPGALHNQTPVKPVNPPPAPGNHPPPGSNQIPNDPFQQGPQGANNRPLPPGFLPSFLRDSIDRYVQKAMEDWQIPGVSVAVVKDGRVVFIRGYGVLEAGKKELVDENTLFMIGSNTKAFTATSLALLEQEKKLSLEDKVTKWLPEFRLNDSLSTREVTIRDLLCHRIGFETFQGDFTYWSSNLSRMDVIRKMGFIKPRYGFRSRWGYCNAAFLTAGEIIPRVTHMPWEAFVQERILRPLHMDRTITMSKDILSAPNAAKGYTIYNDSLTQLPYPMIDNLGPAGSISSSARDMTNWISMQLDSGRYNGKEIIPMNVLKATRFPNSIMGNGHARFGSNNFSLYGLGWMLEDYNGHKVVSHTGGVDGFVSSVCLVPDMKLGIVVLTNTDQNLLFEALRDEIRDAYMGLPYRNYNKIELDDFNNNQKEEKENLAQWRKKVAEKNKPAQALDQYAGKYYNEVYGEIEVKAENGKLNIYFSHHPALVGRLEAMEGNQFLCTYSLPTFGIKTLTFSGQKDQIDTLELYVADFVEFLPYVFHKTPGK